MPARPKIKWKQYRDKRLGKYNTVNLLPHCDAMLEQLMAGKNVGEAGRLLGLGSDKASHVSQLLKEIHPEGRDYVTQLIERNRYRVLKRTQAKTEPVATVKRAPKGESRAQAIERIKNDLLQMNEIILREEKNPDFLQGGRMAPADAKFFVSQMQISPERVTSLWGKMIDLRLKSKQTGIPIRDLIERGEK